MLNSVAVPSRVPFVDLRAQHDELRPQIDAAIQEAIDTSSFIGGTAVESFERNFAAFCGTRHAVTCGSGTDALKLALMAAGVQPGDEVITVPNTFIATVEAIVMRGAHPVFVDVDEATYNMSPGKLAEFLELHCHAGPNGHVINQQTGRPVTAVLPVHLYGLPADMQPILDLARRFNLNVVEDACQAHGAAYRLDGIDTPAGKLGQAAAFSFYPGKNLGALGEGGAVTTDSDEMARQMRTWRDHGQSQRYIHVSEEGWNSRLDAVQCAVLNVKLRKLARWNDRRRQVAAWYRERLAGDERIVFPVEPEGRRHVYHLFVVRIPQRDRVLHELTERGIGVALHYPIPLHLQPAFRSMGWREGDFPQAEVAAASIVSLPMFPHLSESTVDYICRALDQALA